MFKYLLLKVISKLSDKDLVGRAFTDMAFKFFLDLTPESEVIDSSSLTKFRKQRLKDKNLLDLLIAKTIEIAKDNGINLSNIIIVDSTHTCSKYNKKKPTEILVEESKRLRKNVYEIKEQMKEKFPPKPTDDNLENHLSYCKELIEIIRKEDILLMYPAISEPLNYLEEIVNDDLEQINSLNDTDAKVGHKTADSSFFGYKSHIAMTPERLITAVTITTGEKPDGKELETLIEKTEAVGIKVEASIGDGAYSEKENIQKAKKRNMKLVSKLSRIITDIKRPVEGFVYNKDAKRYICTAGHMAVRVALHGKKKNISEGTPLRETHYFDVNKCITCKFKDLCGYKDGQASKTYTVTLKKDSVHEEHEKFQETEEFKLLAKERYKIKAKNSELKNGHEYETCKYTGLFGMELQASTTVFVVNLKRIITLLGKK
jgi:hypothetical protein